LDFAKLKLNQFFCAHPEFDFRAPISQRQEADIPGGWKIGEYLKTADDSSNFAAELVADCYITAISTETAASGSLRTF